MRKGSGSFVALCAVVLAAAMPVMASAAAAPPAGKIEKARVQGAALAGNLQGNDATRDVHVYLPPSYGQGNRRYPVVYFLHGYAVTADVYVNDVLKIPAATDAAIAAGGSEFIVVMPDAFTRFGGSFYGNSPVIGDWESYIAKDLVAWVDKTYRTIARREGRGLAGHSMGGYGTLRIGMKHPEVFGAIYAMSAAIGLSAPNAEAVKTQLGRMADVNLKTEPRNSSNGMQAQASAFAPNPGNPPFFFDLPFDAEGKPVPMIAEKWTANSLSVTVDQNVPALKSFKGVALDVGDQDGLAAGNTQFVASLKRLGVPHEYEIYEGTHGNKVGARFTGNVLPFFAKHLARQ